jgi:hypothetical protein
MGGRRLAYGKVMVVCAALAGFLLLALGGVLMLPLLGQAGALASCEQEAEGPASTIAVGSAAAGVLVGATEYGGPGDPTSGTTGASGVNLLADPDSFAELGGSTFQAADALGGLPYGTALRISWGARSVIADKEDIGSGGGPIAGHARAIDLWWQLAERLGIPYRNGRWSGLVRVERVSGAAGEAGAVDTAAGGETATGTTATGTTGTGTTAVGRSGAGAAEDSLLADYCEEAEGDVSLTAGPKAKLLPDGQAQAPAGAPAAVIAIIAAGNAIAGKPYVFGGGHGLPLSEVAPAYDCSSSAAHLLWGGGLLAASVDMTSGDFKTWGKPGPGRWVTIYASAGHVFMYVAGLRWDTHNAAGTGDGQAGIGWHPKVRSDGGFVVRHPEGL